MWGRWQAYSSSKGASLMQRTGGKHEEYQVYQKQSENNWYFNNLYQIHQNKLQNFIDCQLT